MSEQQHAQDYDFPRAIGQPATRALLGAGCRRVEDVAAFSESEILKLHGVGPRAIRILRQALAEKGLSFASKDQHRED